MNTELVTQKYGRKQRTATYAINQNSKRRQIIDVLIDLVTESCIQKTLVCTVSICDGGNHDDEHVPNERNDDKDRQLRKKEVS